MQFKNTATKVCFCGVLVSSAVFSRLCHSSHWLIAKQSQLVSKSITQCSVFTYYRTNINRSDSTTRRKILFFMLMLELVLLLALKLGCYVYACVGITSKNQALPYVCT